MKKGSTIFITAEFDNTTANLRQPVSTPQAVTGGWKITQEMLVLLMFGLDYLPGDEELDFVE